MTSFTYTPTCGERNGVNSGASTVDNLTTVDSLGRVISKQTRQAPGSSNFDTVSYSYDLLGRVYTTSLPCVTGAGGTCPSTATATAYDALNRPLQVADAGSGFVTYNYSNYDVLQTVGPAPAGENAKRKQMEYDGLAV